MTGYYDELSREGCRPARVDGWRHRLGQQLRFEVAVRGLGISPTDAVVDLGCGTGRLFERLRPGRPGAYLGVDRREEVIARGDSDFPGGDFFCCGIEDDSVERAGPFDYAVAIGTLVDGRERDDAARRRHLDRTVERLDGLGRRGWALVVLDERWLSGNPVRRFEPALEGATRAELEAVGDRRDVDAVIDDRFTPSDLAMIVDRGTPPERVRGRIDGEQCFRAVLQRAERAEDGLDPVDRVWLWVIGGRRDRARRALREVPASHRERKVLERRLEIDRDGQGWRLGE